MISRASRAIPPYVSAEWLSLPDGPEKVAAVILAAEKFAIDWEAQKAAEDAAFAAQRDEHRASWTGRGFRPDPTLPAEIEREWVEWVGGAA
jgi:hypothetical protein